MGPIDNAEAAKRPNQNKRDNKIEPEKKGRKTKRLSNYVNCPFELELAAGPGNGITSPDRPTTMRERKHRVVW